MLPRQAVSCLSLQKVYGPRWFHCSRRHSADARWPGWEVIVGIEVHAQIKSRKKLFSHSPNSDPGAPANIHVSPYDAAFPGTLPHLNRKCVELALRTAIALKSDIQRRSSFDRKHYFYADLPAGYQITQRYEPLAKGGYLKLPETGAVVGIEQIQLEQDTGKSSFDSRRRLSAIDLNRAGTGLMEIVSNPDMRLVAQLDVCHGQSPEEAGEYVRTLQALLRSVGSSDGNMEQGSLRCDVNVSVNRPGEKPGTRCEIKNLNSVKFTMVAIGSEVLRQISLIESGQPVSQETRGFNEDTGETYRLRGKEDAPDYRYMPDPNLPPLLLEHSFVDGIRANMPELPDEVRSRLQAQGLSQRDVDVLMAVDSGREVGFDGALGQGALYAGFDRMTHELLGQLALRRETFKENPVSVECMGNLIDLLQSGMITGTSGKTLLRHMLDHRSDKMPVEIAQELSLIALSEGEDLLEKMCSEAVIALPAEADAVRRGNLQVLNKLVGWVMKSSRGRADAQAVRANLKKMLAPN
ncbi:hypothetical protein HETIRDRAFT_312503 [Heterobasidion irregulare TC 32-1]|uniref:Glutamyl-tRNA(Gln) amidotransferase subunit B, mitochondrial n=1 Tax=Heterobasidion irregulare (strain TC 32-1) TaxID=747525 RepID=W4KE60_HETIT|nr:uncharacterized protein HETIRDRAFT_312503 [Heterobasidion irregulare TC 32-1]ETW84098.1 hypothetical protein HETIRDRAFT_312503 [Heterobasidion irregulare TC 32-1]